MATARFFSVQTLGLITGLMAGVGACGGTSAEDACKLLGEKYQSCDTDGQATAWLPAFDALCLQSVKASNACANATVAWEKCVSRYSCDTLNDSTSQVCAAEGDVYSSACLDGNAQNGNGVATNPNA